MKKRLLACLLGIISYSNSYSQLPSDFYNPSVIRHKLQGLSVVGSVLYIAAHPDDENTRLITYLTKERHLRTGYLSLTRGDGGQNLIGTEQGTDLGILRTEELIAARKIDGGEQFFSSAADFGYSKNPTETFRFWNKKKILKEVVTVIRYFRPDVIICRFPATGEGGHGHHTASAILAEEAFELAADPSYIDNNEQPAWRTTRLLWNTFNFGATASTPVTSDLLKLDVGGFNSLLGLSYGEISAKSRSQHRSQGFGSASQRGEQFEYFKHIKGIPAKNDIMEGIDLSWKRFPAFKDNFREIEKAVAEADMLLKDGKNKELIDKLIALRKILKTGADKSVKHVEVSEESMDDVRTEPDKGFNPHAGLSGSEKEDINYRIRKLERIILASSGIYLDILSKKQFYVWGELTEVDINIINRGPLRCFYRFNTFPGQWSDDSILLHSNKPFKRTVSWMMPDRHYFKENKMLVFSGNVTLRIGREDLSFSVPVLYRKIDPSVGELFYNASIVPGLVIVKMPEPVVRGGKQQTITLKVKAHQAVQNASIKTVSSAHQDKVPQTDTLGNFAAGEEKLVNIDIGSYWKRPGVEKQNFHFILSFHDSVGRNLLSSYYETNIAYPHIGEWNVFYPANVEISRLELKTKVKKIGYISGAGDKVAESLRQLGYQVDELSDEQISSIDLNQYPVIITGVRAHNTRDVLQAQHSRLMEYVKKGGRLIVQYNTNSRVGPLSMKIGPYPFSIARDRVTDENAEVRFLNPKSPFLNKPYKLDSNDFSGWVQERSIYQVTERDSNYQTLFSMNDPGEKASDGSLVYCKYGKGTFIYTGLVFFRELPAGVPGAYKLFINLIETKL